MKTRHTWLIALLTVLLVAVGIVTIGLIRPYDLRTFLNRAYLQLLWNDPEELTRTGLMPHWIPEWYEDDLTELSPQAMARDSAMLIDLLDQLNTFGTNDVTDENRLGYGIFSWYLNKRVDGLRFAYHRYPVTHINGPHIDLPDFMSRVHPLDKQSDCDDYLERMHKVPEKFLGVIDHLEEARQRGIVPPSFIIEKVRDQCSRFASMPTAEHPLYTGFERRSRQIIGLDSAKRGQYLAMVRSELEDNVRPAYARLSSYLDQLLTQSIAVAGVWQMPDGEAYYRYMLEWHCTRPIDPDSLYRVGQQQLQQQRLALNDVATALGLRTDVPLNELFSNTMPTDSLPDDTIIHQARQIMDQASAASEKVFDRLDLPELAIRTPQWRDPRSQPVALYEPIEPLTGQGASLTLNTDAIRGSSRYSFRAHMYHEAVPGHHLQMSLERAIPHALMFQGRIQFTAYVEGWAMYAEKLADELGLYGSATGRMGMIRADMLRTARLMVDIGLHHKRWLHDQAVEFMMEKVGLSETAATAEVDRCVARPGHGCAYKVGEMHIMALRESEKKRLGEAFDLRAFHSAVLRGGAVPLSVLDAELARAAQR